MNKNAKKWVAALRSGEYKQTKSYLMQDGKYCCLGVACDLAVKAKVIAPPKQQFGSGVFEFEGKDSVLPPKVKKWLGLADDEGEFSGPAGSELHRFRLTGLNDACDKNFSEIADIIESEPEGLFAK